MDEVVVFGENSSATEGFRILFFINDVLCGDSSNATLSRVLRLYDHLVKSNIFLLNDT